MNLLKTKQSELPEEFRNCVLLSMGQLLQYKEMVPERGVELLGLVKDIFTEGSYKAHGQLITITNLKGNQLLNNMSLSMMTRKNGVEKETLEYISHDAKDWIYIVQIKEKDGEHITHHQFSLVDDFWQVEILLNGEERDGWSSSQTCFYWL